MRALDDARASETYKAINEWAKTWLQINDLASYLGVHQVLIPVGLYTKEKLVWLNNNLINSVDIDSRLQQSQEAAAMGGQAARFVSVLLAPVVQKARTESG